MPALPNPPSPVVKLNVNWGIEADTLAQTVHYWGCSAAPSATDLATFAAAAVSHGETRFQALANDSVGMLGATARDISNDMGNEGTGGTPWVGTRGTALTPPAAAAVVSHSISRHYRGGHPRTYLPLGVSGDIALTGLWADAFVAAVDVAWGDWVADLNAATYGSLDIGQLINVSYYKGFTPFTEPSGRVRNRPNLRAVPVIDIITGHVTRKNIGSQRRRNRDA